jgi:hypothetical protein
VGERVNEGDEGEGIWWMDFTHLYETELRNLLQLLEVGWREDGEETQWSQCN